MFSLLLFFGRQVQNVQILVLSCVRDMETDRLNLAQNLVDILNSQSGKEWFDRLVLKKQLTAILLKRDDELMIYAVDYATSQAVAQLIEMVR